MTRYYLIHSWSETITPIRDDHYLVEAPDPEKTYSRQELLNAANTPGFAVQDMLPLLEEMEQIAGEDLPGHDDCVAAGFSGTMLEGKVTWRDVARNLLNMQGPGMEPELSITRDLWETFGERLDDIEDPNGTMIDATFLIDGVRVTVE